MSSYIWLFVAAFTVALGAHNAEVVRDSGNVNTGSVSGHYMLSDIYNYTNFFNRFYHWEVRLLPLQ